MAENDSEWYISPANKESSSAITKESSSHAYRDAEESNFFKGQNIDNKESIRNTAKLHNSIVSTSYYNPITQVDCSSSSSSLDSGEFSDDEQPLICLEELKRKQSEITMLRKSKDDATSIHSDKEYLNTQPCPLNTSHKLAVQMLKIKKYKPSTKEFAPPVSQINDGSAWIPEIKRSKLPIESRKDDIIHTIRDNRVVVLSGSTGCGKSTQVPQYILDYCLQNCVPVNIICTQPRRIAATSLAHRVASERGTPLHVQVGYHIGGKGGYTTSTRLRYVTTGILLEMLKADRYLNSYTHIIMDEIHERNVDDDLMLAHLCVILRENPSLKLIIMSATMNVQKFTKYFHEFEVKRDGLSQIPWIDIPVKNFPVDAFYLEDVCQTLGIPESQQKAILSEPKKPSMMQERRDLFISWIFRCHVDSPVDDAFLVFLPGISIIAEVEDQLTFLDEQQRMSNPFLPNITIIKLHSTVTIDEQCMVMQRPLSGYRKIVLATNVAESSITVPDVKKIFDTCLRKDVDYDKATRCYSLNEQWISKDCAEQRRGRAGRLGPGVIYRFVPKQFYDNLRNERKPVIKRTPLNSLLLRSIYANLGDPRELLSHCIDPPDDNAVDYALEDLEITGAVVSKEIAKEEDDWVQGSIVSYEYEVTRLGTVLAQLPLDLHSGLLVVYGAIFGSLYDTIIIAAILQNRGVIVQPPHQEIQISAAMKRFSLNLPEDYPLQGGSDLISHLRGYLYWEEKTQYDNRFDLSRELSWCQKQFISLYWIREIQDLVISIRESLAYQGICPPPTKDERDKIRRNRLNVIITDDTIDDDFDIDGGSEESSEGDPISDIDQAIRILDNAASSELPNGIEIDNISQQPPKLHTYNPRYHAKAGIPVHQVANNIRTSLNPWMNVFDRAYEISNRPVRLSREPNVTLLTILLTAAFHQNLFSVSPNQDNRVFRYCPKDYDRHHTIEFSAQSLPPKPIMIETLEKDIGVIHKILHPETDQLITKGDTEYCYIEFVKPAKPIWTHSRDRNNPTLPDAVFLAQKFRTVKNSTWTEGLGNSIGHFTSGATYNSEDARRLRFSGIYGCTETATMLSPIFHSKLAKAFLSKSSLFFPLIINSGEHRCYSLCAGKLLAVDYGKSHVAEHITCMIGPLTTKNNIGDVILAFFANKLDNGIVGGWHVQINLKQYPLFNAKLSDAESDLILSVRYFLKQALFETNPIGSNSNGMLLPNLEMPSTCREMVRVWNQCKMTPDQAGKLLVDSLLMIL
ncbi:15728_t:CDS:10 [Funneliformis mosseae]|uniref:15728_t:CDS:1 n=1 Tax=Funneliformis mosseae TaxID=27381 RepID=A0A9N9B8B9_FUNMO|nr:15728_t:CDS:10 [Funneliformis mosseae]